MLLQLCRSSWPVYFGLSMITGCASTQINSNTLDIASTYDELITKQFTFNIRKTVEDPYGLPAYVKVTAQTAATQNTITPTLTLPLSNQIQTLAQFSQAPTGLTTQTSRTLQFAGKSFGLSAADQWNQTYTITPVTDTDQLRRLRALFQYVTGNLPNDPPARTYTKEFESIYPIIEVAGAGGTATPTATTLTVTVDGKFVSVKQSSDQSDKIKQTYVRRTYRWSESTNTFAGYTWALVSPDVTFIKQPGCILCDYGNVLSPEELKLIFPEGKPDPKDTVKAAAYNAIATAHKLEKN